MSNDNKEDFNAVRTLLLASPPGQFDLILDELQTLLINRDPPVLTDDAISSIRNEYNSKTGNIVISSNKDPNEDNNSQDDISSALRKTIDKHVESRFKGKALSSGSKVTRSDDSYRINLYAERYDPNNFNAASWFAKYNLRLDAESDKKWILDGSVDLRSHVFENEGNFHYETTLNLDAVKLSCDGVEAENISKSVIQNIRRWEDDVILEHVRITFENIGDGALKTLRRVMPVTRTRFDWNVRTHQFAKTLTHDVNK
mmetsp:Transcript_6259/g.9091  ORF Transcript_6259/g.9091 Transcript_6259/m.9091 type:complete len:257 (+) Transcript_6259:64-834(+)